MGGGVLFWFLWGFGWFLFGVGYLVWWGILFGFFVVVVFGCLGFFSLNPTCEVPWSA